MLNKQTETAIGFLLIGGIHHILHLVPPAAELAKVESVKVNIYVRSASEKEMCVTVLKALGLDEPDVSILTVNPLLRAISPKLSVLFSYALKFSKLDALIVAERTSTILRFFPGRWPLFIHIPHGAGDRKIGFDPRIRHFDHVLVAGEKDKERMIADGIAKPDKCHVTGYIKPYVIRKIGADLPKLFEDERPIVFYNPHFHQTLSSWDQYGFELLESFALNPDFNFIVAPHIRLFANAADAARDQVLDFAKHPNIHIDLGSPRSTDMTYTRLADIYVGDVSSQVYEFLSHPKPCVFIGPEETPWRDNPDYAHWRYGKVCHTSEAVSAALDRAFDDHKNYKAVQTTGCRAATGDPEWNPVKRAANFILSALRGDM